MQMSFFLYSKKFEKMHKWWIFDHKLHEDIII